MLPFALVVPVTALETDPLNTPSTFAFGTGLPLESTKLIDTVALTLLDTLTIILTLDTHIVEAKVGGGAVTVISCVLELVNLC